VQNTEIKDS